MRDFQKYIQGDITAIEPLKYGGNNQIFKIDTPKRIYILKEYSEEHMDNWPRGINEFKAISYLWEKGFRNIPEPISFREKENIAVYSYKSGKILKPEEIGELDIICAVDFLAKLHNLREEDKKQFGPASSACFSLKDYLSVLDRRFENIHKSISNNCSSKRKRVELFLRDKVYPKICELEKEASTKSNELEKILSLEEQVLTHADFSFHNILASERDNFTFLDFEYFGRDDPARQILDFLHHDKSIGIKRELKSLFLEIYRRDAKPREGFEQRLKIADPLVGMAWILIYMNIFSKNRGNHAAKTVEERLDKAESKLNNLRYFER